MMMKFDETMRHLSPREFSQLGMSDIAYIRHVVVNGVSGFAMHAADGTPIAVAGDRASAVAALLQNDLVPVSVH